MALWLAWTLVIAYTLAPFDFRLSARRENNAPQNLTELALHALAFAALGLMRPVAVNHHRRGRLGTGVNAALLIPSLAGCLLIEVLQWLVPGRHPEALDFVVNSSALTAGHLAAPLLQRRLRRFTVPCPRYARITLLVLWAISWTSLVYLPNRLSTLDNWDPAYPLLIGNEKVTMDQEGPWEGTIQMVAIYDRALSPSNAGALFGKTPTDEDPAAARRALGLLALYDFTSVSGATAEPQGRLQDPALRIDVPLSTRTADAQSGVSPAGSTRLTTAGAAGPLTTAIAASNAFTVEVWCRPANVEQTGPARIVSVSESLWRRNFTLAQEGDALYFRVRNGLNGENGLNYELRAPRALSADVLHLVATYDRGVSRVFRNGSALPDVVDLRQPSVLLGLGTRPEGSIAVATIAALTLLLILTL